MTGTLTWSVFYDRARAAGLRVGLSLEGAGDHEHWVAMVSRGSLVVTCDLGLTSAPQASWPLELLMVKLRHEELL